MCAVIGVPRIDSFTEPPGSPPTSSAAMRAASLATGILPGAVESSVVSRPRLVMRTRSSLSRACIARRITVRSDQRRSHSERANAPG